MTAASGIVHNEFHSDKFAKEGGTLEMCQLWVNLPAKHKMDPPRYQEILSDSIPVVSLGNNSSVRVIAGQFMEATGPAQTCTVTSHAPHSNVVICSACIIVPVPSNPFFRARSSL